MTTTITPSLGAAPLFTQQGTGASPGYAAVDLRRHLGAASLQEGVYAATDFEVVQRAAGANLSVDIGGAMAAGGSFALVQGDTINGQGLYVVAAHSAAINEAIAAADATNPRVDQVILEIQDNVHDASGGNLARVRVLTGTPTGGATLDNRTGAAALPGSALLLADVHVPAADTTISNSQIRDRRKWARGAFNKITRTANAAAGNDYAITSTTPTIVDSTNLNPRIECSGAPVRLRLQGLATATTAQGSFSIYQDGAVIDGGIRADCVTATNGTISIIWDTVPAAGSRRFAPFFYNQGAGTTTLFARAVIPMIFSVEELVRQNTANNATTSG